MKKPDKLLKYLLYAVLLCIGVIAGIAIHRYYNLPISQEINIIDLATLVTTIFLAVYIPEVLDRKLQIRRDKKDLIEKRVEELQAFYRKINLLIQNEESLKPRDVLIIRNTLDIVQHRLELIFSLLRYSNLSPSFEKDIDLLKRLDEQHRALLQVGEIEDSAYTYGADIQQKEELLYNQIDEASSLLIFKLSET